jgi:hypothetical protein
MTNWPLAKTIAKRAIAVQFGQRGSQLQFYRVQFGPTGQGETT